MIETIPATQSPVPETHRLDQPQQTSGMSKPVAFVVEDDEMISYLLNFRLQREGFDVLLARDGREACRLMDEATQPPMLILLDVMLPYMDGFELITRIKGVPAWSDVPIIMLTSKTHEREIVRALDAGASDYVVKPFRPEELMARLRRVLR